MGTVQVLIQIKIVWIFMPVVPVSRCDKMITIAVKYNPLYIFSSLAVCLPAWEPLKNICHFPQVGNCWWMIFLVYQLLLFALSTLSPSVCTLSQKGKKKFRPAPHTTISSTCQRDGLHQNRNTSCRQREILISNPTFAHCTPHQNNKYADKGHFKVRKIPICWSAACTSFHAVKKI